MYVTTDSLASDGRGPFYASVTWDRTNAGFEQPGFTLREALRIAEAVNARTTYGDWMEYDAEQKVFLLYEPDYSDPAADPDKPTLPDGSPLPAWANEVFLPERIGDQTVYRIGNGAWCWYRSTPTLSEEGRELAVCLAVEAMRSEILDDMARGVQPKTVASYSELHDHVDANMYAEHITCGDAIDESCEIFNEASDIIDRWLRERVGGAS